MGSDVRGVVSGAMGACVALLAWNLVGPTKAEAYPTGAISYGANPVASWAGSETLNDATPSATKTLMTAPSSQDFVITDVVVNSGYTSMCGGFPVATLSTSGGDEIGKFYGYYDGDTSHHFESGLRVPAGESLELELRLRLTASSSVCSELVPYYTISGYYAEP